MISILKTLYRPMLAASLALHGVLLMAPVIPSAPAPETEAEAEPEPEEEVSLSSLASMNKPSPLPLPQASPKPVPKAAIPSPVVRPNPVPNPVPVPSPSPTPIASPAPTPTPTPIAAATPIPTPTPTPTETAPTEIAVDYAALGTTGGQTPPYYQFPQPELFFTAESLQQASTEPTVEPTTLEGIANLIWGSNLSTDQAYDKLPELFPGYGNFTAVGTYGGGAVYRGTQGNNTLYFNLVEGEGIGLTTFVVVWLRDPNLPATPSSTASSSTTQ